MTKEEFIAKAEKIHSGENIDYSQVNYKNNRTKVKMIDPVYGEFWQTPSNHLKGQSHPMRKKEKISLSKRLTQDEIIKKFEEKHIGEGLDYSKVKYINMHTKVCIIDPIYGEYWQEPVVHLKGCGHKARGIKKTIQSNTYTTEEFVRLSKKIYGDKYDLSKVNYERSQKKVCIICPQHGEFWQYPDAFLQGKSCPKCGNHLSHAEDEIYDILVSKLGNENIKKNDRKAIGLELDLYIPNMKFAIEFNGLRWHSELFKKDKNYHLNKLEKCQKNGIRLIQVFEDEWISNKKIVISKILRALGIDNDLPRVYARKSVVREISSVECEKFLKENHIQGFVKSKIHLGIFVDDELFGVMSFKDYKNGLWELTRFATNIDYICVGFGGKLFKYFVKTFKPNEVKSFADRRWTVDGNNNLYVKLGFKLDEVLKPNYTYTNGHGKRFHKFGFRKSVLHKRYNLPMSMTETEMTTALGYDRIWDCGLFKYVWRKENANVDI